MNYLQKICCFIMLMAMHQTILGQQDSAVSISSSQSSTWKGFKRLDYELEGRAVRLVLPDKALPGKPWIWRARFPDWHTEADSILVKRGFHLAYIQTDNLYGSPKAMVHWDLLYDHLTQEYGLSKKVALMGVSRGGLFVYNWAAQNPEKVSCIYAEAPVCDFKSWPAGWGSGAGSQEDWERLKSVYGFGSDEEARSYQGNPIDNLAPIAAAKIPILHMIGLEDQIVPPEENTFPLILQYLKLGGPATVVPCTKGEQKLQGHHFDIETPEEVADFIYGNAHLTDQ